MGKLLKSMVRSQYRLQDDKLGARDDLVFTIALDEHNKSKRKEID